MNDGAVLLSFKDIPKKSAQFVTFPEFSATFKASKEISPLKALKLLK